MITQLKDIIRKYGYFYFKFWILHLLVLISLFTIDFKYFLYSVGIYILYIPLIQVIHHEYIGHEYVKPKNQWVDLFCLLITYTTDTNIRGKKDFHIEHHRHWKTAELDPTQQKMHNVPGWRYILGFCKPVDLKITPVKCYIYSNSKWAKHLDAHYKIIYWVYTISCLVFLPLQWFIVLCIYLPWFGLILFNLHDYLFHGPLKSKDHSWYLLFYGSQAWHIKHHEEYQNAYYGPGFWKWLNLVWYYQLLLFKPVKK